MRIENARTGSAQTEKPGEPNSEPTFQTHLAAIGVLENASRSTAESREVNQFLRLYQTAAQNIAAGISALNFFDGEDWVGDGGKRSAQKPEAHESQVPDWKAESASDESEITAGQADGEVTLTPGFNSALFIPEEYAGISTSDPVFRALEALECALQANSVAQEPNPATHMPALASILTLDYAQALTDKLRGAMAPGVAEGAKSRDLSGAQLLALLGG